MKTYLDLLASKLGLLALLGAAALLFTTNCSSDKADSDTTTGGCPVGQEECNGQCVDLTSNGAHCGQCNNLCPAGLVCTSGLCDCPPDQLNCDGACRIIQEDPTNCGSCDNMCGAEARFCSQGTCSASCGAGLTECGGACPNTTSSEQHCGQCNNACGANETCTNSACVAKAPSNPGAGGGNPGAGGNNPGAGGNNPGAGGSTPGAGGGTPGAGGTPVNPGAGEALNCMDPVYGMVQVPAENVISDFASGEPVINAVSGRGMGAEPWHAYAAGDTNDPASGELMTPSASNPKNAANKFEVDAATSGPCSTDGSLHVTSPGNTEWGMGIGIDFMARTAARKKQAYDASKYTGIGFWAKGNADIKFAYFKIVDAANDADVDAAAVPMVCSYDAAGAAACNQHGIKNTTVTKDWTYYKMYFSEVLVDPAGPNLVGPPLDPSKLTAFQIHINPNVDRDSNKSANAFDLWVDDVHFLTEAAPALPTEAVTFTTQGNKIMRNGAEHRIRGLVRPSMEWDEAGFGISREDVIRMKAWGPNTIRLAVFAKFWFDDVRDDIYRKHVKRAVSWILQEGMDVILDLHYVNDMPVAVHTDFWADVVKDPFYANNGRIIFELYNEPNGDFNQLHQWMQATTTMIRQSSQNLILVGGIDFSFDISGYVANPITGGNVAYVSHPYVFKTSKTFEEAYINPSKTLPVVATEFGDAHIPEIGHPVGANQCDANPNSSSIQTFEANGISWTAWAWIVDAWGCGFPQIIKDYGGEPNVIGVPVKDALLKCKGKVACN